MKPRHFKFTSIALALLAAGLATSATAQNAPGSALQSRPLSSTEAPATTAPTPTPRTWQMSPGVTVPAARTQTPASNAIAPGTIATKPIATPATRAPDATMATPAVNARAVVPDNLFSMEDRAIIIVGGKPVAAGDVKKQIQADLKRLSGPVKNGRTQARKGAAQAHLNLVQNDVPAKLLKNDGFKGPLLKPPAGGAAVLQPGVAATSAAANPNLVRPHSPIVGSVTTREPGYFEARDYCNKHGPSIERVRGTMTPEKTITIEGMCLGSTTGTLEVIGQFPGGRLTLSFVEWNEQKIVARVPVVRGAPDHPVAITVVRRDKVKSPAAQHAFVATREQVAVPDHFWTPDEHFDKTEINNGGGDIFSGYTVYGYPGQKVTKLGVKINPQCALDVVSWSSSVGRVDAVNGWDNPGPPNEGKVDVVWSPQCTTKTTNYVLSSSSTQTCRIAFDVKASAFCPVGVAP